MNQIRNMSEEDKIEYFVSGLNRETSNMVACEEPASLVEAKALATKVETYYVTNQIPSRTSIPNNIFNKYIFIKIFIRKVYRIFDTRYYIKLVYRY